VDIYNDIEMQSWVACARLDFRQVVGRSATGRRHLPVTGANTENLKKKAESFRA
jgi:hypothetical protein